MALLLRDESQSVLQIKVSDDITLDTDRFVVSAFSSCLRDLPGDAAVWDVSGLVLEGQQVEREIVVAWLDLAYQSINGQPFESIDPMELNEDREPGVTDSMLGLVQLLAFSDAVGSSRGLLLALDKEAAAAQPALFADFGDKTLELDPGNTYMLTSNFVGEHELLMDSKWMHKAVIATGSREQRDSFLMQVTYQLEALLFLAYKLQLERIQLVVLDFIHCNSFSSSSMLWDRTVLDKVLSKRVMATQAAADASTQALQHSLTTHVLKLAPHTFNQQLQPVDLSLEQQQQPITFTAVVQRPFLAYRKGQRVEVAVDLFKDSLLTINQLGQGTSQQLPLRLLLGEPL
jgi:hypothetical protein